jgi:hypothetical protein
MTEELWQRDAWELADCVRSGVLSAQTLLDVSLGRIERFTVRSEGETFEFDIDETIDYGFPLDHLNEHRVTGEPVIVVYEERQGRLVALEIEDA